MTDKKQMRIHATTHELAAAKKQELALVEQGLKETVSRHALYVDNLGNVSTGAHGLYRQINIRVKKAFGCNRQDMPLSAYILLISLLDKINQVIITGEKESLSRPHIKDMIYKTIEDYGKLADPC